MEAKVLHRINKAWQAGLSLFGVDIHCCLNRVDVALLESGKFHLTFHKSLVETGVFIRGERTGIKLAPSSQSAGVTLTLELCNKLRSEASLKRSIVGIRSQISNAIRVVFEVVQLVFYSLPKTQGPEGILAVFSVCLQNRSLCGAGITV
ncbi:MAG: hypothetical protein EBS01_02490 [Verrucomicrobia bacterium]|nr:hypothetical protein [Verrucomicrobiota bacterium]